MMPMPRLVSLIVMAALLVLLGITFYHVMAPFLMPLFLAAVFAMLSQPVFERVRKRVGGRTGLAAGLTTALVLTIVLVPLGLGIGAAAWQLERAAEKKLAGQDWNTVLTGIRTNPTVQDWVQWYGDVTGEPVQFDEIELEVDARLREASTLVARKTLGSAGSTLTLLGALVSALVAALTFVIAFFYFLADGAGLIEATINLIPIHRGYQRSLISKFDQSVRAVVMATFAAALGQGIATAIGMLGFGPRYFFIITILATLTALVPLLGTWLVWGPYAIYLAFNGQWMSAILLTLYGSVFVGLLDNVIRTYVLHSNVKLHPLLAFVSVLGGLQVLGLWGVFIGPIVASCLHALLLIFNSEVVALSQERQSSFALDTPRSALPIDSDDSQLALPAAPDAPTEQEIDIPIFKPAAGPPSPPTKEPARARSAPT